MASDRLADLRAAAIAEGLNWLGTPYRHQASRRGRGADCLGLIRGIYRALYGVEPEHPPRYTPDWSEFDGSERLLEAAKRHLTPAPADWETPGVVQAFRMRARGPVKHLGLLLPPEAGVARMIHAYSGHGVLISPLGDAWRRRRVAAFDWPDRA